MLLLLWNNSVLLFPSLKPFINSTHQIKITTTMRMGKRITRQVITNTILFPPKMHRTIVFILFWSENIWQGTMGVRAGKHEKGNYRHGHFGREGVMDTLRSWPQPGNARPAVRWRGKQQSWDKIWRGRVNGDTSPRLWSYLPFTSEQPDSQNTTFHFMLSYNRPWTTRRLLGSPFGSYLITIRQ